jgi:hypothetical protein
MPINSLKPLFDKFGAKSEISYTNVATWNLSPMDATEVSECQSFGDCTTLAAAKTKAKAACLSHI